MPGNEVHLEKEHAIFKEAGFADSRFCKRVSVGEYHEGQKP